MISRGQYHDIRLYELTAQDLLDNTLPGYYQAGNVLIFSDRQNARIGQELARADDLLAAWEFLDQKPEGYPAAVDSQPEAADLDSAPDQPLAALGSKPPATMEAKPGGGPHDLDIAQLTRRIEQRDELLRDLSESLKAQKEENELLNLLLEQSQTRLAVDELSRNELMGDLQEVSAHTMTVETTLEKVLEEKFRLEQELAEHITELVEVSLINDDLRRILKERENEQLTISADNAPLVDPAAEPEQALPDNNTTVVTLAPLEKSAQTLTMASGKQIHIYHEFPQLPKRKFASLLKTTLTSSLRIIVMLAVTVLLIIAGSVLATSAVNHISFGDSLDLLLKSLTALFKQ